jgi:hypothetical protein
MKSLYKKTIMPLNLIMCKKLIKKKGEGFTSKFISIFLSYLYIEDRR